MLELEYCWFNNQFKWHLKQGKIRGEEELETLQSPECRQVSDAIEYVQGRLDDIRLLKRGMRARL